MKEVNMPKEFKPGCVRPESGPKKEDSSPSEQTTETKSADKKEMSMIRVGKKAPDFTASAYFQGKFVDVQLSEYLGKWVILCFYPGDFTFV